MTPCPACGSAAWPYQEMTGTGGLVTRCANVECGVSLDPSAATKTATVTPIRADVRPIVQAAIPQDDVLGIAKARLAFCQERIAELRKYEAEEARLSRMIHAAEEEQ